MEQIWSPAVDPATNRPVEEATVGARLENPAFQGYALLRIAAGLLFLFHGLQKLFGMYGGQTAELVSPLDDGPERLPGQRCELAVWAALPGLGHVQPGQRISRYFAYCAGRASNLVLQPKLQK